MRNEIHISWSEEFPSCRPVQHNLCLSAIHGENRDIFSAHLYPVYIPETDSPTHQSEWQKGICVSRPRRFGKSMAANMLAAYYDRSENTEELFQNLAIREDKSYKEIQYSCNIWSLLGTKFKYPILQWFWIWLTKQWIYKKIAEDTKGRKRTGKEV